MTPIIHFQCRSCGSEVTFRPAAGSAVSCHGSKRGIELSITDSLVNPGVVTTCVSCGHDAFYVQKDFNRRAGLVIVGIGIAASIYFLARGRPMWAMGALVLTALIDLIANFIVGDVTVCYACHAIYRGFNRNREHEPFDLRKLEKYGGRMPRGLP